MIFYKKYKKSESHSDLIVKFPSYFSFCLLCLYYVLGMV
jgi:hypothetical protein